MRAVAAASVAALFVLGLSGCSSGSSTEPRTTTLVQSAPAAAPKPSAVRPPQRPQRRTDTKDYMHFSATGH
jgi:uncharacterized lipoprotein